jgi:hypothetical protein
MKNKKRNEHPLIVELNGLPGCGKTTITNLLVEKLKKEGINATKRKNIYKKRKYKANKLFGLIHRGGIRLPFLLLSFFLSIKPFRIGRYKYISKLIHYYLMYLKSVEENKYDIILMDEGIIQYINAAIYPGNLKYPSSLKKLLNTILNTLNVGERSYFVVDCLANEHISGERIIGRKDYSRFDKMEAGMIKPKLKIYSSNFPYIRRILNDCRWIERAELDMRQPPEKNCNLLFDEIDLIRKGA